MEWNDIYDENRRPTGGRHLRGSPWAPGQRGLTVCVWVGNGRGQFLLTRRAPGKSFAGTWENSGGAVQAGENSRQGIVRELWEETGILARETEFQLLSQDADESMFYDHYFLLRDIPLEEVKLLPGETDDARWVSPQTIHAFMESGEICQIIAAQYRKMEAELLLRNFPKNKA